MLGAVDEMKYLMYLYTHHIIEEPCFTFVDLHMPVMYVLDCQEMILGGSIDHLNIPLLLLPEI